LFWFESVRKSSSKYRGIIEKEVRLAILRSGCVGVELNRACICGVTGWTACDFTISNLQVVIKDDLISL
jgi:hypothetical protein